jgi:hypothetical protein
MAVKEYFNEKVKFEERSKVQDSKEQEKIIH